MEVKLPFVLENNDTRSTYQPTDRPDYRQVSLPIRNKMFTIFNEKQFWSMNKINILLVRTLQLNRSMGSETSQPFKKVMRDQPTDCRREGQIIGKFHFQYGGWMQKLHIYLEKEMALGKGCLK